jgi:hypothetical protein
MLTAGMLLTVHGRVFVISFPSYKVALASREESRAFASRTRGELLPEVVYKLE